MFQLVIHGRGGQGAKTMAMVLAQAVIEAGSYAQAYPEFGPERTGAPVYAFLRVASNKIITKEPVRNPNAVVILDDSLLSEEGILNYLAHGPALIVNSTQNSQELLPVFTTEDEYRGKLYVVDAAEIIAGYKNKIHPTAPIIGRLLKITGVMPLDDVFKVFQKRFTGKVGEEVVEDTFKAMEEGYYSL
ncbi:MAG: 2-oxoacid:acceptor oxidoreductase family protein [Patescibacteria group bacterium]|nr:2-oxoacid:acceptor oxidoreductase family protein [Patescibacteria group bacterium]